VEHPDQSALLTHFCHRARPQAGIPIEILQMSAPQRLESILWESRLRAFAPPRAMSGKPASAYHDTTAGDPIEARVREVTKTEWGVACERGQITVCESKQAARQPQAASGGELVYCRTWITTWS
jgi:hypothetical protein